MELLNLEKYKAEIHRTLISKLDLEKLGVAGATEARLFSPGARPQTLPVSQGTIVIPDAGLWSILELRGQKS